MHLLLLLILAYLFGSVSPLAWGWLKQITLTWSSPAFSLSIGEDINHVPGDLTPLFSQLSHKGYIKSSPSEASNADRLCCWLSEVSRWTNGTAPGVMHILTPAVDSPQSMYVCFFYQGRAWEQGPAIGCNWAKLPLIRWIEKKPLSQKGTRLLQNSSPFLPPQTRHSKISPRWRLCYGD